MSLFINGVIFAHKLQVSPPTKGFASSAAAEPSMNTPNHGMDLMGQKTHSKANDHSSEFSGY